VRAVQDSSRTAVDSEALALASVAATERRSARVCRVIAALAVAYAVATAIACGAASTSAAGLGRFPEWVALPAQLAAIASTMLISLRWRRAVDLGPARHAWPLICAFATLSLLAMLVWNLWRPLGVGPVLSRADALYLADYALLSIAYVAMYLRLGGSLRARRVRLEALSMFAALLVTMWTITLGPLAPKAGPHTLPWYFAGAYAVALAALITSAALTGMCLSNMRRHSWLALLVAAGLVDAVWEIGWLGSWLSSSEFLDKFFSYGDVLCFTFICVAAALAPAPLAAFAEPADAEQRVHNFFPALTILVAVALVTGLMAASPGTNNWTFTSLVVICAVLLLGRQHTARADLARLNSDLALREAGARVTELVRESPDLLVTVGVDQAVVFVSPAAALFTGRDVDQLTGKPARSLFGREHEAALADLLTRVRSAESASASLELTIGAHVNAARTLNVVATNRFGNRHIRGITLTVSDITAERALERELLDVSNNERMRLAADLHDGLGQNLTGVALLLQAELGDRKNENGNSRDRLESVVGVINQAILSVRELTHSAAPLYNVGGSLRGALMHIGTLASGDPAVSIEVDPDFDDSVLDHTAADHLYRIALEALRNARRHAGCQHLRVMLRVAAGILQLTIVDDGVGFDPAATPLKSFGLRLIDYRARVIGAVLAVHSRPGQGTRIEVRIPLSRSAAT